VVTSLRPPEPARFGHDRCRRSRIDHRPIGRRRSCHIGNRNLPRKQAEHGRGNLDGAKQCGGRAGEDPSQNDRLREQAREHERQRRYEVYEETLAAHIELFSLCQVGEAPADAVRHAIERVHSAWSAIQLTEIAEVRTAMARYGYLIAEISTTANETGDNWSLEFQRRIDYVKEAANELATEMRKGIALAKA
jgi:hypothetical protein